jgi:hypothetical protein
MYVARLICSDPECAEEVSSEAGTLRELETLVCECGCALELIGWPDVAAAPLAEVIIMRARAASPLRAGGDLPEAA